MKKLVSRICQCALLLSLCLSLSGCFIRPYRYDLYQGNIITAEEVAQIQPGMSQEQVRYLLGTPLLEDVFHTDRWDYVYLESPSHAPELRQHLVIYFCDGQVERFSYEPSSVEAS